MKKRTKVLTNGGNDSVGENSIGKRKVIGELILWFLKTTRAIICTRLGSQFIETSRVLSSFACLSKLHKISCTVGYLIYPLYNINRPKSFIRKSYQFLKPFAGIPRHILIHSSDRRHLRNLHAVSFPASQ